LCQRWKWHQLDSECPLISRDLLPLVRKKYRRTWPDCRLVTAEERLLGLPRCEADVPGSEAPLRFQDLREGAPFEVIEPIYLHNRRDLISLVGLRYRLQEEMLSP
ncbi:MAG: ribonuclease H-like domain-containing protein, partial [Planctomycetota bacterium]